MLDTLSLFNTKPLAESGAVLELVNPVDGQPVRLADGSAMSMTLLGEDSDAYRAQQRVNHDRRQGRKKIDADYLRAEYLELLVACCKGWNGFAEGGQALPCTPDNVRRVLSGFREIFEQVDRFIHDRANFLPKPAQG